MKIKAVSGIMLTLLLIGMLTLAFNIQQVEASETIYIRADGSVDPDTAPISSVDNVTYTFTDNIYDSIMVERDNIVVDGTSYTVQGTGSGTGIGLSYRTNVTIKNMEIKEFDSGIHLYRSSNNSIYGNNITNNKFDGISISYSSNNSISGNHITANDINDVFFGIYLYYSSNNSIYGNNITANDIGIRLVVGNNSIYGNNITNNYFKGVSLYSSNNSISGNNITNNDVGIHLVSGNNSIYGNNITNNELGVSLEESSNNNIIYHNNFVDNVEQLYGHNATNTWDNGYPSGGNYWSDYTGEDVDGDGIGDTPYEIDANNRDRYPLREPWPCEITPTPAEEVEEVPFWMLWWFWTIVVVVIVALAGAVYFLKRRKPPTPTAPSLPTEYYLKH